ncbi:MAG: hypothetical protein L6Q71_09585, partial [Planctomycetes bacterium]|nr:hypothetical protein [Planctomycetota bacterium]
ELPSDLASGVAGHTQAWVMLPFLGLFVLYHIIAFRKLPEERVLELKPFWAIVYLVAGWLFVEIMYVGDISFIYFAF